MSVALYDLGGLRFWTPDEIACRHMIKTTLVETVTRTLLDINQMWRVVEVEAPLMMPVSRMSAAYDRDDVFMLQDAPGGTDQWALRAETTDGSYMMAQHLLRTTSMKAPLCVYQSGRSYRRENTDGATAARLRFNEFNQLEFQCVMGLSTTAPIPELLRTALLPVVAKLTGRDARLVDSDRVPSYASETVDIELYVDETEQKQFTPGWREVASTSRREDFPEIPGMKYQCMCFEIAFGLDRLVELSAVSSQGEA